MKDKWRREEGMEEEKGGGDGGEGKGEVSYEGLVGLSFSMFWGGFYRNWV